MQHSVFIKQRSQEPELNRGPSGSREQVFIHGIILPLPTLCGLKCLLLLFVCFFKKYYEVIIGYFLHAMYWYIYVNSFSLKDNPEKGVSYNPKYIDRETED